MNVSEGWGLRKGCLEYAEQCGGVLVQAVTPGLGGSPPQNLRACAEGRFSALLLYPTEVDASIVSILWMEKLKYRKVK